ncbi:MAG TPA: hypothetical protein VIG69_09940 [Candidatus Methylomirabilis sp.]
MPPSGSLSSKRADIIDWEILRGIVDDIKVRLTRDILRTAPILRLRGLRTIEHASHLSCARRRKGRAIRNTVDCPTAATCLKAGAERHHDGRDLEAIAGVHGLGNHRPARN